MAAFKVIDLGYDKIVENMEYASKVVVSVGIQGKNGEVAGYAAANEFGADRIPQRSFIGSTVDENEKAYLKMAEEVYSEKDAKQVLEQLGLKIAGDIQSKITSIKTPPNVAFTIAKKGSSNPLIDTGRMRQSVTSVVVPKNIGSKK